MGKHMRINPQLFGEPLLHHAVTGHANVIFVHAGKSSPMAFGGQRTAAVSPAGVIFHITLE